MKKEYIYHSSRTGFQPFLLVGDQQQSASHNDPAVDENL